MVRSTRAVWGVLVLLGVLASCETARNPGGIQRDLTPPNNFLRTSLQTDQGKVRINGEPRRDCTPRILPAALLGVARTRLAFSGASTGGESTSETLIGQGCEEAAILHDIGVGSPPTARPPRHKPEMDRVRTNRVSQKGDGRGVEKPD